MAQINTNLYSLNAQRNLDKNSLGLASAVERLSSGLRVNSARDDATGLATGMTIEDCTAKYRVHAAGTQRAVNAGFVACQSLIKGTPGPWDADSKCVLRGIADVKTEQGLSLLARQCQQ